MAAFPDSAIVRTLVNIAASQTDSAVVAAVTGSKLRVLSVVALAGGTATDLTFNSKGSGSGTACSPLYALGIRTPLVLPYNPSGWCETNAGEALTVTTGAGSTVGIEVETVAIPDPGNVILNEDGTPLMMESEDSPLLLE